MESDAALASIVRDELSRILGSPEFDASERNRRFLSFAVEAVLSGQGDRIKAYTVATTVFGRRADFDPQVDSIVRIEAGRLRRSLERYYLIAGLGDRIRISIPKGSYVPTFALADSRPVAPVEVRRPPRKDGRGVTVLVRPFEEEGDQRRCRNFASGFTRQVIGGLTRFTDLVVYGPQTATTRDGDRGLPLDVDYVLSGGVMLVGETVGVEALLIDAHSGRYIWAESFNRGFEPSQIVALRDEIATSVVRALAQPYGVLFANKARDVEGQAPSFMSAYDAVTRYYLYARTYDRSRFRDVFDAVERAVKADPDFAEGITCLSRLWTDVHRFGFDPGTHEPAPLDRAAMLAERVLQLVPASSRAHYALGLTQWLRGDLKGGIESYEVGLSLNPNDTDLMAELGFRYVLRLDVVRGVAMLEESFRRNPSQPGTYRIALALWHLVEGRNEAAALEARRSNMLHLPHGPIIEAVVAARMCDTEGARLAVETIRGIEPAIATQPFHWLTARGVHPILVRILVDGLVAAGLPIPDCEVQRAHEAA